MTGLTEQGNAKAQYGIGMIYAGGEGVPQGSEPAVNSSLPAVLL
ncbi:MAG: hypothetical protein PHT15_00770 [Gallionellaceae bacterium]|nr:hypothetical protein [Gallionellaceae bacterium]